MVKFELLQKDIKQGESEINLRVVTFQRKIRKSCKRNWFVNALNATKLAIKIVNV